MPMSLPHIALALTLAAATAGLAFAQGAPQRQRIRGTVESLEGTKLVIKSRSGEQVTVKLADDWAVSAIVKASRDDIKPGVFVGAGAMPQGDGTQKAVQVLIFPEAMRGTGEGFGPWNLAPGSTMTDATVGARVTSAEGAAFTLTYKGGSQTVVIPPDAMIITLAQGDKAELKPGAVIALSADKAADGTLNALARISVGRDGVAPN